MNWHQVSKTWQHLLAGPATAWQTEEHVSLSSCFDSILSGLCISVLFRWLLEQQPFRHTSPWVIPLLIWSLSFPLPLANSFLTLDIRGIATCLGVDRTNGCILGSNLMQYSPSRVPKPLKSFGWSAMITLELASTLLILDSSPNFLMAQQGILQVINEYFLPLPFSSCAWV